jgi:cell division GTPase FtsZ
MAHHASLQIFVNKRSYPMENITPGFDIETPDIPLPVETGPAEAKDAFNSAFKFAMIGVGQGGSRLTQAFYRLGYQRCAVINTALQDLASIHLPEANKLLLGHGGAGKQPEVAAAFLAERKEDALDFMRRCFGPSFDRVFITAGLGGGTGAGMVVPLVSIVQELQAALRLPATKIGIIAALPKNSEGAKSSANAYRVLQELLALVKDGHVSPLILIDNERTSRIFPGLSVDTFWDTANSSISRLLHLFNSVSIHNSSYTSFDAADFRTILDSGLIVLGATPVSRWADATDISFAVRDNLKKNILTGGVNLATGSVAGAIVIGGATTLSSVPQEYLDHAFDQLSRLLKPGSTIHRGIYSGSKDGIVVYTAVGGLAPPAERLEELRKIAL